MTTPPPPPLDDKTKYEQLCNDFRSLNGFLWQTPLIFMTLTGGLWFAVASFDLTETLRVWLLLFAGVANLLMIAALYRLRYVMQRIMTRIQDLDARPDPRLNYFIVTCFSLLLLMAAIGSFMASARPGHYFNKVAERAAASARSEAAANSSSNAM
jgi:hypothetical protein